MTPPQPAGTPRPGPQLRALVTLSFQLLRGELAGLRGLLNTVGTALALLGGLGVAAAMAFGLGAWIISSLRADEARAFGVSLFFTFSACLGIGVLLPLLRATGASGLDGRRLLVFPVSVRRLFLLDLATRAVGPVHLLYLPTLGFALAIAATAAQTRWPVPLLGGLLLITHIAWAQGLQLLVESALRHEKVKATLSVVLVVGLMAVALGPVAWLDPQTTDGPETLDQATVERTVDGVRRVLGALPPGLAARGLVALRDDHLGAGLANAGGLALWSGSGLALGFLLFVRALAGGASRRRTRAAGSDRTWLDLAWVPVLSPALAGVASQSLRYLLRSTVGKILLVSGPALFLLVSWLLGRAMEGDFLGMEWPRLVLYLAVLYTAFIANNFFANAFAWDGGGARTYFLGPLALGQVLAGKNLAAALGAVLVLGISLTAHALVIAPLSAGALLDSVLIAASVLLACAQVGNFLSILFPQRRAIDGANNAPSTAAALVSTALFGALGTVLAVLVVLPAFLGRPWLRPLLLAVPPFALAIAYRHSLRLAARLLHDRRQRFLDAVCP